MKVKFTNLKIIQSIGLSLLVFILLLAAVLPLCVVEPQLKPMAEDDISITDWRFVWGGDSSSIEGKIEEWNIANVNKPVTKQFGSQFVRMRTTLPVHAQEKALQIVTAGNPVKVLLDGKEIYNNGYGAQVYTGNRTNVVTVSASDKEQQLELYLQVPLSFDLDVRLISPASAVNVLSLLSVIGISLGIGVILTAILIIILMGLFSVKGYQLNAAVWVGGMLLLTGLGLILSQAGFFASGFSSPWLYKIEALSILASSAGMSFISIHIVSGWRRNEQIVVWAQMIYAVLYMILPDIIGVWLLMLAPFVLLAGVVLVTLRMTDFVQGNQRYSALITFAYLSGSFCILFDFLYQLIGWMPPIHELSFAGIFVFCYIAFFILVKQSIRVHIRLREREKQIELDSKWVQRTISSCAVVFTQQDDIGFCRETANAVKDLVLFDRLCREENASLGEGNISICIALMEGGAFHEIYTENQAEACRYEKILEHSRDRDGESLLFGARCVDMLLRYQSEVFCIIHVEGVTGGISSNLQNIMHIAYTNFESALNSMKLHKGMNDTQINVFLNLAELAEYRSHNTGEHLKVVSEFVNVLCEELGIEEKEREIISIASMMHDIGKLAIPEAIIDKEGKLTEEEFEQIKKHIYYGYNILSKSSGEFMEAAAIIAKEHHERFDGTGYMGIKGKNIHLYARIVMVADVFDALLSERSYKKAWPEEEAAAHINEQSGRHFDPEIIKAFNRCKDRMLDIKHKYDGPAPLPEDTKG